MYRDSTAKPTPSIRPAGENCRAVYPVPVKCECVCLCVTGPSLTFSICVERRESAVATKTGPRLADRLYKSGKAARATRITHFGGYASRSGVSRLRYMSLDHAKRTWSTAYAPANREEYSSLQLSATWRPLSTHGQEVSWYFECGERCRNVYLELGRRYSQKGSHLSSCTSAPSTEVFVYGKHRL